ncbi:YtxH domain-containing protein [Psychroflexus montanilacus]|uniref:YtxH domain-containing protein n=1 Tax=Psychroflexus montanilacus TaxID=2873598 RepID=UPI001CD01560|nr:YtxH domain-containing protein [Psychroflexus montanilacus]MBZ9650910.1 YtxH domain-containing protein [Psychroflexus montanilacus]
MKTNVLDVLAGIGIGALIGILYAPEKGTTTRNKIKDKSRDVKDLIEEEFDDFIDAASKKYNSIVENGESILDEGDEYIQKEMKRAKSKAEARLKESQNS